MSGNILPQYQSVADPQAAEALSEVVLRIGEFKFESSYAEFPPKPSYLAAVGIAYREDVAGEEMIRRQVVLTPQGKDTEAGVAEAYLSAYKARIDELHTVADMFSETPLFNMDNLARRAAEKAEQARLRTVAAFVLFSTVDTDETFAGLAIPKRTFVDIPLEDRQQWMELRQQMLGQWGNEILKATGLEVPLSRIMQGDPVHGGFAMLAGALSLPRVEAVEATLGSIIGRSVSDKFAGLSRAERRKLLHHERRQRRKEQA